jgi:hypothetical protein
MSKTIEPNFKVAWAGMAATLLLLTVAGCSQEQKSTVNKIPAGAEFSGFFKSYANLKPVEGMDGAVGYASTDAQKNLHKYIACVIDPVEVYLASDADGAKLTETARSAATEYFHAVLVKAVSASYPVVDQPGPLVLRLRTAIVGVDFGGAGEAGTDNDKALANSVNIGKVRVEMELVDSETGEQIAALVDKESLGSGAEIGSTDLARNQKWAAAREAFDGWAHRVHDFLDASSELSPADADRADKSYQSYDSGTIAFK